MTDVSFVSSGTIRLAVECFGNRDHPALILIMGATASMLGWPTALCKRLADLGLYVLRFDHRDTGQSHTCPPGAPDYYVEDMARDALAIMDARGISAAHLMGMSLGGFLAQMLAVTHPDRVTSLTLIGSEPLGWDGPPLPNISQPILDHFAGLATLDWSDRSAALDFLLGLDRLMAGSGAAFDAASAVQTIRSILDRTTSPASMFNHAQLEVTEDWTGRFRSIARPTLVLTGEADPVLPPEKGRALGEGIRGARFHLLRGVGHELPPRVHAFLADCLVAHVRQADFSHQ